MGDAGVDVIEVAAARSKDRLDAFLRDQLPGVSRGAIQRLLREGAILVNGRPAKLTHQPRAGERIEIRWPAPQPAQAEPEAIGLDVLFEDDHLLVLNKPPGMVVHPSAGHERSTLVNALLHHCAGRLSGIGGVARPGIVHRLDRDTSGCLVVAKDDATHVALAAQFAQRQVTKIYQAILCGELPRETGTIQAAIARHPSHRKRMAVASHQGREAITTYRVVERLRGATRVEAGLHTGRTHQLRVHFQHVGFPLAGDLVYGRRQNARLTEQTGYTAPRQLLHAWRLSIRDPGSGSVRTFEAPWPEDFRQGVAALRAAK
jgi:23S rRNA pseudouridine1911/1915/1917 synthase